MKYYKYKGAIVKSNSLRGAYDKFKAIAKKIDDQQPINKRLISTPAIADAINGEVNTGRRTFHVNSFWSYTRTEVEKALSNDKRFVVASPNCYCIGE